MFADCHAKLTEPSSPLDDWLANLADCPAYLIQQSASLASHSAKLHEQSAALADCPSILLAVRRTLPTRQQDRQGSQLGSHTA